MIALRRLTALHCPSNCNRSSVVQNCGMRSVAFLLSLFALVTGGCRQPSYGGNNGLMDEIETKVELPSGALPIEKYSRYYAWKSRHIVKGVFIIHHERFRSSIRQMCGEGQYPGSFPCGENKEDLLVDPNQRRWIRVVDELPGMSDGGCGQLTFEYDVQKKLKPQLECNGQY